MFILVFFQILSVFVLIRNNQVHTLYIRILYACRNAESFKIVDSLPPYHKMLFSLKKLEPETYLTKHQIEILDLK